jgi:hypothetical protein
VRAGESGKDPSCRGGVGHHGSNPHGQRTGRAEEGLAHDRALEILELNRDVLHNLAMALLEHEVLDQKGLMAYLKDVRTAPVRRSLGSSAVDKEPG